MGTGSPCGRGAASRHTLDSHLQIPLADAVGAERYGLDVEACIRGAKENAERGGLSLRPRTDAPIRQIALEEARRG